MARLRLRWLRLLQRLLNVRLFELRLLNVRLFELRLFELRLDGALRHGLHRYRLLRGLGHGLCQYRLQQLSAVILRGVATAGIAAVAFEPTNGPDPACPACAVWRSALGLLRAVRGQALSSAAALRFREPISAEQ